MPLTVSEILNIAGIIMAVAGGAVMGAPDMVNRMTVRQTYWPRWWDRLHATRDERMVSRYRRAGFTIIALGATVSILGIALGAN